MNKWTIGLALTSLLVGAPAFCEPDWSKNAPIPREGRANPYELPPGPWADSVRAGRLHALFYPVEVTGLLLPYRPIESVLNADSRNLFRRAVQKTISESSGFRSFDDAERWLGMHVYPETEGEGDRQIPFPGGLRPEHRMGFTLLETPSGRAFTISCAECHSANLFGHKILGMSNRFPRANDFFARSLRALPFVTKPLFQLTSGATREETALYGRARYAARFIAAKKPAQLGLDTSLAQVALSLSRREQDSWATRNPHLRPRPDPIRHLIADSKPAVWWNVKYKNRWLSDGSVVSGNPIYTNFLWNEIGRGTDLRELDRWFARNPATIRDLTSAVFATEAPRWSDFFPDDTIAEQQARRGEKIFLNHCARCHGVYEKAWSLPESIAWTAKQRLQTTHVNYPTPTPVIDVGTDPGRYQGMTSLVQLNALEISKRQGVVIEPQRGYVPPPLVGIWARWPYFHNNSVPNLCAVLTRGSERPKWYWARPADNPARDFDRRCNGYPQHTPENADPDWFYDTTRAGLSNLGHDEGIFLQQGREILSSHEKMALIEFLQTL